MQSEFLLTDIALSGRVFTSGEVKIMDRCSKHHHRPWLITEEEKIKMMGMEYLQESRS
ncbi:MAG: hypothetical protein J0I84_09570 [Terrimonas sp.]|nr:hypothetical protein [Terrimonas sp.]